MGFVIASRLLSIIVLILFADIWAIRALRFVLPRKSRLPVSLVLLASLIFLATSLVVFLRYRMPGLDPVKLRAYYVVATVFIIVYIPKLAVAIPLFVEDILVWFFRILRSMLPSRPKYASIKRKKRKSSLLVWPGLLISAVLLVLLLDGTLIRKHRWTIREVDVPIKDLPSGFDGYRIVQFSDVHLGSFFRERHLRQGLSKIRTANPDLVVFTGDIVNSSFNEAIPYSHLFRQILSKDGKFSILGNHDMDDFMRWTSDSAFEENVVGLEEFWNNTGFTLLRNEFRYLTRDNDTLVIAGVDNWGLPPFKKRGDLRKALGFKGDFKVVLLSHDPSHWRSEVLGHEQVALTLSGHTHAMQFGFRFKNFSWSPSSLIYPEWDGLHSNQNQFIYVNPGFGYLGFLGRVGIRPEITVLVLKRANQ